jgi:protein O-GlcNAc transferase
MNVTPIAKQANNNAAAAAAPSWTVNTRSGVSLHVPNSLQQLSTFVLLEQERWFEAEMNLLPHLLQGGTHALDIGANHGVYTLEMARIAAQGDGHIWAFEPTVTPRTRLLRSVQDNGVAHKVTVVPAGLSDEVGEVSFAVQFNSELNSREGQSGNRETVQLDTLDNFVAQHAITQPIGFIKLDAEGEELRVMGGAKKFFAEQSPVVMFELKHGNHVNTQLVGAWLALGYDMFRWSAELEVLLPFDIEKDEVASALNLVAVRPQQQQELAARGLLATAQAIAEVTLPAVNHDSLAIWCTTPALVGSCAAASVEDLYAQVVAAAGEAYAQAFNAVASAHAQTDLTAAQRVALMRWAQQSLLASASAADAAAAAAFGPEAVALIVHALNALGQPAAAVMMVKQLWLQWASNDKEDAMPFVVPPQLADLQRPRTVTVTNWLRQVLGEFLLQRISYSSYFAASDMRLLNQLLLHPDHSAEIERRYLLAHVRGNRSAPTNAIRLLPHAEHTANPQLWEKLIQMMQPMAA